LVCGFVREIILSTTRELRFGKGPEKGGIDFLKVYPLPPGSSGIIVLAGKSPQNPDNERLRGQNLDNAGFRRRFTSPVFTAFAFTIVN
jgi:hypothetical protein